MSPSNASRNPQQWTDLLGLPWLEGGRVGVDEGTDCLGVVVEIAARRGIPGADPWANVAERWAAGERDVRTLFRFPPGWRLVELWREVPRPDSVVLFNIVPGETVPGHVGWMVEPGLVLSSRAGAGVYSHPYGRLRNRVVEAWSWEGARP